MADETPAPAPAPGPAPAPAPTPSPAPAVKSMLSFGLAAAILVVVGILVGFGLVELHRHLKPPAPVPIPRPMPADPETPCEPCDTGSIHGRGHRTAPNIDHLRELSFQRHAGLFASLPPATEPDWDSRAHGWVGPVKNQGQCGSCWDFSGTGIVEIAYNKAGVGGGPDRFILSEQYTLSCGKNGGCGGDDNTTVLAWAKSTGMPLSAAYGPYQGRSFLSRCNYSASMRLYKIPDWGFADSNGGQGVTPVQDIKNAIKAYGAVGCGIAANTAFESWGNSGASFSQPFRGGGWGSRSINHDIILVGWHDDASLPGGGYWILRNSWGTGWGVNGYMAICYGANLVGSESVFAVGPDAPAPGPEPSPTPPAPTPGPTPQPPGPAPGPLPVTPLTISGATTIPAYGFAELSLSGSYSTAGWMVFPDRSTGAKVVTSYTAPKGAAFVFSGPPGTYDVGAYAQAAAGIKTLQATVTIEPPSGPAPTPGPTPVPPVPTPTPPGPAPSPQVDIDPAFETLGTAYRTALGPAYAASFEAGAKALESGQTFTAALGTIAKDWDAARVQLFTTNLSPKFGAIIPETTPDASVTPEQRAAMVRAWRSLAAGLRK